VTTTTSAAVTAKIPQSTPPTAVIDEATKRFGEQVAVDGVSLTIEPGTIVGVIGPSGAGKTTTIRMLTGAVIPDSGTARVLGEDPSELRRSTRERIGYMPQLFTLYRDLSVRENVDFVASLFGLLWRRRWSRTQAVLELVELWDHRRAVAGDLSGGQQRRLELACALVHEPDFLILDEPTAGIDPILRAAVWTELHRLRDAGRTLIVTTQYVTEAAECDTVALIADGRLVAVDSPDGLRRRATGGEVIELETSAPLPASLVRPVPGVRTVRPIDESTLRLTVDDAAETLPALVEAVGAAGHEVERAEAIEPSFDEVFRLLVERARADGTSSAAAAETGR
jgi:ABC-2 type transport system ATP-binding protein